MGISFLLNDPPQAQAFYRDSDHERERWKSVECCISKKETGRGGHAATLISIFSSFFTTFDVASHAPAFIGYSVERRQLNLSSATSIQILIMYRLFIIHPPFSFVLCVLGVFHRIIASIMTQAGCARRPYRTLPHHLRCVRRSRSPRMSNGKNHTVTQTFTFSLIEPKGPCI